MTTVILAIKKPIMMIPKVRKKNLIPKTAANKSWTQKSLDSLVRDDYLSSSWKSEISSIWFYTDEQREIGIPVASWLTRLTNDWINFWARLKQANQKINAMHNLSWFWLEQKTTKTNCAIAKNLKTIANINDKRENAKE